MSKRVIIQPDNSNMLAAENRACTARLWGTVLPNLAKGTGLGGCIQRLREGHVTQLVEDTRGAWEASHLWVRGKEAEISGSTDQRRSERPGVQRTERKQI